MTFLDLFLNVLAIGFWIAVIMVIYSYYQERKAAREEEEKG